MLSKGCMICNYVIEENEIDLICEIEMKNY